MPLLYLNWALTVTSLVSLPYLDTGTWEKWVCHINFTQVSDRNNKVNRISLLFFYLGFTALSRIFHLYRANRSSKVGETGGKNDLTIHKQNLAYTDQTAMSL